MPGRKSIIDEAKRLMRSKLFSIGVLVALGILGTIWITNKKRYRKRNSLKKISPPLGRKSFSSYENTYVDPWIGSVVPSPRQFRMPIKDRDSVDYQETNYKPSQITCTESYTNVSTKNTPRTKNNKVEFTKKSKVQKMNKKT